MNIRNEEMTKYIFIKLETTNTQSQCNKVFTGSSFPGFFQRACRRTNAVLSCAKDALVTRGGYCNFEPSTRLPNRCQSHEDYLDYLVFKSTCAQVNCAAWVRCVGGGGDW